MDWIQQVDYLRIRILISISLLLSTAYTQAQLCTGSLGDPVVSITFGSGASPGPQLAGGLTSYTYFTGDCPNDGSYAIRSTTTNCFNTWHTITSDHTGNPQGYFMLVNASNEPGDFYVQSVKGLCANTTYEFAAWILNVLRPANQIKPNLTFTIEQTDGTVLGLFNTGDISVTNTPQWKQYGFNFKTPPGTFEVLLRIRNNAPGGIGNDLALDDITLRPCGPLLNNVFSGANDTVNLCEGDIQTFDFSVAIPPFYTNPVYQWQLSTDKGLSWNDIPGATTLSYTASPATIGAYWYRISVADYDNFSFKSCRVASNVTAINIHAPPVVNAGPDKVVIKGNEDMLQGRVQDAASDIVWTPSDYLDNPTRLTPKITPLTDIKYTLTARSVQGCSASDEVFIKLVNGIYIPDSFTPNGDGKNDLWRVPFIEAVPDSDVKIFNRYGSLIYHVRNSPAAWDGTVQGKNLSNGVYVYVVQLGKDVPPIKGFIHLIR